MNIVGFIELLHITKETDKLWIGWFHSQFVHIVMSQQLYISQCHNIYTVQLMGLKHNTSNTMLTSAIHEQSRRADV